MITPIRDYYLFTYTAGGSGVEIQSEDVFQGLLLAKGPLATNTTLKVGMNLIYKAIETIDVSIEGDLYVMVLEKHICAVASPQTSVEYANRNNLDPSAV